MRNLFLLLLLSSLLFSCEREESFVPEIPEGLGDSDAVLIFGKVGGFGYSDFNRFVDGKTYRDRYPNGPSGPDVPSLPFTQPAAIEKRHWDVIPDVDAALLGRDLLAEFPHEAFNELDAGQYCGEIAVDGICSAVGFFDKQAANYRWFIGNFSDHPVLAEYMKKVWITHNRLQ